MSVKLTTEGLEINGQLVPIYSGAVHYWRLERECWPLILDNIQALGFEVVETYIPWAIHEITPGHYDWGQTDPRKDIEAFMNLCEARGLWLIVRPGPLINAELTDFGFPEWVLLNPQVQARTALDSLHLDAAWGLHPPHQFPVPSYASEAFYAAVGGWFDAVCPIIARHLAPHGCVIAVQSDNETCYLFHEQTYATDYSPDSLALYQSFLAERYNDLAALNAAYGRQYASFADIQPPRDCGVQGRADLPWHLDWVAYKEYQIRWSVARLARMLRERGLAGVPIFHDIAFQYRTPLDISVMQADADIDWVGMNLYQNKEGYRSVAKRMRFLAGATPLPFVPELGCGLWSHHPGTPPPEEEEFITLSTLMYGLKAFSLYMLVERERWQGSPITRHGALRPDYAPLYQRLTTFLRRYRFWRYRRYPKVLALLNFDLGRYAAMASTLHYAHADLYGLPAELFQVELNLGLRWDPLLEADEANPNGWLSTLLHTLESRNIDYNLADSHLDAKYLMLYPVVFLQAVDFMNSEDQERLADYAHAGGHLVIGPGMPSLDPALQPCSVLQHYLASPGTAQIGKGQITWIERDKIPAILDQLTLFPPYRCDHPEVDLILHHDSDRELLFIANPSNAAIESGVTFDDPRTFTGAWACGALSPQSGKTLSLTLPAYSVQVWEVAH